MGPYRTPPEPRLESLRDPTRTVLFVTTACALAFASGVVAWGVSDARRPTVVVSVTEAPVPRASIATSAEPKESSAPWVGCTKGSPAVASAQGFGNGFSRFGDPRRRSRRIRQGDVSVSEGLPPEVVTRIIRGRFGSLRACYDEELARDPGLGGSVSARLVIQRDGSVGSAALGPGTKLHDRRVSRCVVHELAGLSFPEPTASSVVVDYTLLLEPSLESAGDALARSP